MAVWQAGTGREDAEETRCRDSRESFSLESTLTRQSRGRRSFGVCNEDVTIERRTHETMTTRRDSDACYDSRCSCTRIAVRRRYDTNHSSTGLVGAPSHQLDHIQVRVGDCLPCLPCSPLFPLTRSCLACPFRTRSLASLTRKNVSAARLTLPQLPPRALLSRFRSLTTCLQPLHS